MPSLAVRSTKPKFMGGRMGRKRKKFLGVDEVSGDTLHLCGDSDGVEFRERFLVRVRPKSRKEPHVEKSY